MDLQFEMPLICPFIQMSVDFRLWWQLHSLTLAQTHTHTHTHSIPTHKHLCIRLFCLWFIHDCCFSKKSKFPILLEQLWIGLRQWFSTSIILVIAGENTKFGDPYITILAQYITGFGDPKISDRDPKVVSDPFVEKQCSMQHISN